MTKPTTTEYPLVTLGAYTLTVIPRIRALDSVKTFSVQIFDNEGEADIMQNPIGWASDTMKTMAPFDGQQARFDAFKAAGHTIKDVLKAARSVID